jgi:NTP pyrophosphatase (non-canonical NTP hydrolase)
VSTPRSGSGTAERPSPVGRNPIVELKALQRQALELTDLFDRLNTANGQTPWNGKDLALGFTGDVGDLAKAVQAAEGSRTLPAGEGSIEHELADCLWSVLVLADRYGVDLEQAFTTTMEGLEDRVKTQLAEGEQQPARVQSDA